MPNNDSLKILITAQLDENASKDTIQKQLNTIQSKLNLTIGIDTQQISQIANQVKQLQSQFEKQSKGIKIIDDENVISSINQIKKGMPEIYTSIDKALEKYKQFGQVKIEKSLDPVTRELNGFTLQLEKAQGLIEKIKFDLVQLKMPDGTQNVFQVTNRKITDDTEKIREKQLRLEQKVDAQIQKQNEKLQQQLELFKRQAEINAKNLQRRYGDAVDTNALNNYLASVRSLSTSTPDVKQKMDELNMTFKEISANVRSSSSHVLDFGEALKTAMVKFPVWLISGTIFVQTTNFFQKGIEYVNELNKALTEIAIVTGQTQQEVSKLGEEYNKLAIQMGVTTKDIADASVEFYRQGLSQEEVMKRVQVATEYAKISSLDFNKAAEILTATTNSMNVDIERVADVFSYLGDATATGADEIGEAFQKVGGSAGALNLNFEKVASWIAVLSSKTRESAVTVGDSIKSILARIQNLKEKGFDETDGTQINEVAKALATVGIQLVDANGQFRNFGQVMDELGTKWKNLDSRTKSYIATTVAGTYQQSRFLNLMEGYSDTIPLYEQALQSAGTTQQKFNTYLESNEAALNRLKASWEGLWQSSFDSGAIKAGIGLLELFVRSLKLAVDTIGLIPTVTGIAVASFLAFNNTTRQSIMQQGLLSASLVRAGDSMKIASGAARLYQTSLYNLTLTTRGVSAAVGAVGTAVKGVATFLGRTALPIAAFMVLSWAISKVTEAIVKQYQQRKELEKQLESYNEKSQETYLNDKARLDSLITKYKELSSQKENGGLDTNQEKEYLKVQQELAAIFPNLISYVDEKGNKHLKEANEIDKVIAKTREMIKLKKEEAILNAQNKFQDKKDEVANLKQQYKYKQERYEMFKNLSETHFLKSQREAAKKEANLIEQELAILKNKIALANKDINAEVLKITNAFMSMDIKINPEVSKRINELIMSLDLSKLSPSELENVSKMVAKLAENLTKAVNSGDKQAFNQSIKEFINRLQNIGVKDKDLKKFSISFNDVANNAKKASQGVNSLSKAINEIPKINNIEDLNKALREAKGNFDALSKIMIQLAKQGQFDQAITIAMSDAYQAVADKVAPLNELLEKMAQGKQISAAKAMELIQKEHDLANAISIENGMVKVNAEAVYKLRDTKVRSYADMNKAVQQELLNEANAIVRKIYGYKQEVVAIQSVADAKRKLAEMENDVSNAFASGNIQIATLMLGRIEQFKSITENLEQLDQLSKLASQSLTQVGTSFENLSDSQDKANKSTEKSIYVANQYKLALSKLNAEIQKTQTLQSQHPKQSEEYRRALQQEITLLQQKEQLMEKQAKSLEQQIKSGKIQQTGIISGAKSTTVSGNSTEAIIWNFFSSKGFSDGVIAGIIGNLKHESGLNTTIVNPASGATGLAQWLGGRLTGLKRYAASLGRSWKELDVQLNYMWKELNSTEKRTLNWLLENQNADPTTVAIMFEKLFERSGGAGLKSRISYANQYYQKFANGKASKQIAKQQEARDKAQEDLYSLKADTEDVKAQIHDKYMEIHRSKIAEFDRSHEIIDNNIDLYEKQKQTIDETSKKYRQMIQNQIILENRKAASIKSEIAWAERQLKYDKKISEAGKDELRQFIADRQKMLRESNQKNAERELDIQKSKIASFDKEHEKLKNNIDLYEQQKQTVNEPSKKYRQIVQNQIILEERNRKSLKTEIKWAQNQIKNNKLLNDAGRNELSKFISDRQKILKKSNQQIAEYQKQIIDSTLASYQKEYDAIENNIQLYETKMNLVEASSAKYRNYLQSEIILEQRKQKSLEAEKAYLEGIIKNNKNIDDKTKEEYSKRIVEINNQLLQIKDSLSEKQLKRHQSNLEAMNKEIEKYSEQIDMLDTLLSFEQEGTDEYNKLLSNQINLLNKKVQKTKEVIEYTKRQLEAEKILNEQDRNQLVEQINQATDNLMNLYDEIRNKQQQMFKSINNAYLKEIEKTLFNGKTEEEYRRELEKRRKEEDKYLTGLELQLEVEKIRSYVRENNLTLLQEEIDLLNQKDKIEKASLERLQKQLEIRQLEMKLQNLMNQKNIQQLTKKSDGTFDFEYVADQEEIERTQQELMDKRLELIKFDEDLRRQKEDEDIDARTEYMERLRDITQKALNGEYRDWNEFVNDVTKLNKMLATDISVEWSKIYNTINTNTQNMVASIKNYLNEISTLAQQVQNTLKMINDLQSKLNSQPNVVQPPPSDMSAISNIPSNNRPTQTSGSQTGTIKIEKPINLWKRDANGNLEFVRVLKPGEEYKVYGYDQMYGGQFNVGAGYYITDIKNYVNYKPKSFDTGGYTGNDEGLAFLHSKEIVLNKVDTKNILEAVNITRSIADVIKKPLNLLNMIKPKTPQPVQQIFHIDSLNFPNVTSSDEIQNAIKNLPKMAMVRLREV